MKRRDFLKSVSALAGSTAVPAPVVFSSAKAQSRQETLLIVSVVPLAVWVCDLYGWIRSIKP